MFACLLLNFLNLFLSLRSERERTIQEVYNSIPFALRSGSVDIEVADALSAHCLDLETISDVYEPTSGSLWDYIWGMCYQLGTQCVM